MYIWHEDSSNTFLTHYCTATQLKTRTHDTNKYAKGILEPSSQTFILTLTLRVEPITERSTVQYAQFVYKYLGLDDDLVNTEKLATDETDLKLDTDFHPWLTTNQVNNRVSTSTSRSPALVEVTIV